MAVRNGRFSETFQHPLAESTVRNTISHVAQTFRDHGERNPTKDEDGETGRLLQRLYRGLQNNDPNGKQQKALPVCVLRELAKRDLTEQDIAIRQLAIGAFFFACRSCEYLLVPSAQQRRTTTLTLGNIRFFRNGARLDQSSHDIDTATCVTLTFVFQKKDLKHDSVSQLASGDPIICPVRQWAALVKRIRSYPGVLDDTTVDTVMMFGRFRRISSKEMVNALRDAASAVGEERLGFDKEEIGTHSLRSGAAMSMYLGECPVYTIMMIGRCESVLSHSQNVSRNCSKLVSTDQIADESSSDSWTEISAHVSRSSMQSKESPLRGNPADFFSLIQACTATSHEGDNYEIQSGQNLEVQPKADFSDLNNDTAISEFPDNGECQTKCEGPTCIKDEISKESTTSAGKRSLLKKVKSSVSKSSPNDNGDQLSFTTSSTDIIKELKSRASKLFSPSESKSEQEQENRDFHTMIQAHTATSHEGQNFEIQPKLLFPDILTDATSLDEATSIRDNSSKTSTVSTEKRSFLSKVKSIVSKPPSKSETDPLTFSTSRSEHTKEVGSKSSKSLSQSNSTSYGVGHNKSRGSYDSYSEMIDQTGRTANTEASSWEQEEGKSLFYTMIQALTATSHEGQNFEIKGEEEFSDVEKETPNSTDAKNIEEELSRAPTELPVMRSFSSKFSSAVSKSPSKFEGCSFTLSTFNNDTAREIGSKASTSFSQSNSKSVSLTKNDCRESYDSCREKKDPKRDASNSVASSAKVVFSAL
ncbi:hypothetical protein ACHAXS_012730 [Conticribra weissflogii]